MENSQYFVNETKFLPKFLFFFYYLFLFTRGPCFSMVSDRIFICDILSYLTSYTVLTANSIFLLL